MEKEVGRILAFKEDDGGVKPASYEEVIEYVKEYEFYHRNTPCYEFDLAVKRKIEKNFPEIKEIRKYLKNTSYYQLDDEQKEHLELYREKYEKTDLPITYDSFIRFICFPDLDLLLDFEAITAVKHLEKDGVPDLPFERYVLRWEKKMKKAMEKGILVQS